MLDGVSLDQLRTFIAAADEGSFSAAGRRLSREFVHLSPRRWLLDHLGAKLAFLRAGFGSMPLHVVEADLASGELV